MKHLLMVLVLASLSGGAAFAQQDGRDNDRRADRERWRHHHYRGQPPQPAYEPRPAPRVGEPDPYAPRVGEANPYAPKVGAPNPYATRGGDPNPYATRGGDPAPQLPAGGGTRRR